ncbi:MAG: carboxypeptidase regulatory-like domain-containing protein [Alphaproteobacteria bacterium]|nr:carboxypeptidase regulatory-like domain-containing protein [Alphaproteobacteria bacterium]
MRSSPLSLLLLALSGCAHHAISGLVIDRNGQPVPNVVVSLDPGGVQIITDSSGGFTIDYLRDDAGERINLEKRTEYEVEAFRAGYHVEAVSFAYKRGELELDPITLKEDTIRVDGSDITFDPAEHPDRSHSAGGSYEGE